MEALERSSRSDRQRLYGFDLIAKIDAFVQAYNAKATPFVWTATAQAILDKVTRLCKAINGTKH